MDSLLLDLRFGLRQLRKAPVFTLAAILTLALGIGANATIFTWFSSIVLNPIPGADSRGLMSVRWHPQRGGERGLSWPDYLDYAKRNHTIEKFAVIAMQPFSLGDNRDPERIWGMLASANYFDTLGVKAALGRTFVPSEDDSPQAVAVLSDHLWRTRFGADPGIIGRDIRLNRRNFTVIGVVPEPFEGSVLGLRFDLWVPAAMRDSMSGGHSLKDRANSWLMGQVRMKPGVNAREVESDLTAISVRLADEFNEPEGYSRADVGPVWREGGGSVLAPLMMLLMGVVGVVLLIACANVANLLLARGVGRSKELAIRLALGVGRTRLIRQLLIENALLAGGGLAAALAVLPVTIGALLTFTPQTDLPIGLKIKLDSSVYVFTVAISAVATLLFGLLPAIRASRPDVMATLKEESAGGVGRRRLWLSNALVVAQVALSMVLLVSAGLFLKSLGRAASADPGFDPRGVLVAGIDLQSNGYDAARARVALEQMTQKIAQVPGVTAVSTTRYVPLTWDGNMRFFFDAEGYVPAAKERPNALIMVVGADYFHVMNIPMVAGREFGPADTADSQKIAIVNESLARRYFAKTDPVGRRLRFRQEERVIVGVARNAKHEAIDKDPGAMIYLPSEQYFAGEASFLIRTAGDPLAYARASEDAIHAVDPALPVFGVRSLGSAISASYVGQQIGGSFLGLFGAVALALATIGLYGVLAYTVAQRSREVGIRMALGASRTNVLSMILGEGMQLAGIGLAAGLALAFVVTRFMRTLLVNVSPTDLPTMLAVSALLSLIALAASFVPARRATRIDPIAAIRHQ